jgi:AraC-like DNA-binding protein
MDTSTPSTVDIISEQDRPGPKGGNWASTTITIEGRMVGRNNIIIPPEEVTELAGFGCTDLEIAGWFGVKDSALTRHFKDELLKGRMEMKSRLRKAQLNLALSGNAVMLIWLGKNLLGQSDNPVDASANQPLPWSDDAETPDES